MSDSGGDGRVEPTELVAGLAGLLLSEETISGLLDIVVNLAASTVAGVDGASVSMLVSGAGQWETSNASSESVREVDEAQYEDGAGPCVEAMRTGEEVTIAFPADRWPTFAERAMASGVRSVLSLPLKVRGRTTGALNLYSTGVTSLEAPSLRADARITTGF